MAYQSHQSYINWVSLESTNHDKCNSSVLKTFQPDWKEIRSQKRQFPGKMQKSVTKKSIVPPLTSTAAKNGFHIWNQREKLHQKSNRARQKLTIGAL